MASRSPRRAELIGAIGLDCDIGPSGIDDGDLQPGAVDPAGWVMALAYLKASAGVGYTATVWGDCPYLAVLGADTICELDGTILGQPENADHADAMIRSMMGRPHGVFTGLAMVCPKSGERELYCDTAVVTLGHLTDEQIDSYIDSGAWRGKAGGYNIAERLDAGWPIECDGDTNAVMGLETGSLSARLTAFVGAG